MHAAPPVRVTVGPSRRWLAAIVISAALAAANLVGWLAAHAQWRGVGPLAGLAALVAAVGTTLALSRRRSVGDLAWDGEHWHWRDQAGTPEVAVDFDGWLLLRFDRHDGTRHWIAVSRRHTRGPWAALRAALYSRRPADLTDVPPA